MITHFIYHIQGRKVGCTKDLEYRKHLYLEQDGEVPEIKILEELHDATDQGAGDREWWWADKLGYKRGNHYIVIMNAVRHRGRNGGSKITLEQRREIGRLGGHQTGKTLTIEQKSANARSAGSIGGLIGIKSITQEQRQQGGRTAAAQLNSSGKGGCKQIVTCPHCGLTGVVINLKRYHFDKCKKHSHTPVSEANGE